MKLTTRIDKIRAVLKKNGPMTVMKISEQTGISRSNVTGVIAEFRGNPGRKMRIRKTGKIREGYTTLSYVYELSNEPDAVIEPVVNKRAALRPRADHDAFMDRKRIEQLAAQSQPFRDPMIWALFGEGSSTNTLGEQGYGELRALSPRPEVICEGVA